MISSTNHSQIMISPTIKPIHVTQPNPIPVIPHTVTPFEGVVKDNGWRLKTWTLIGNEGFKRRQWPIMGWGADRSKWMLIGAIYSSVPLVNKDRRCLWMTGELRAWEREREAPNNFGLRREKLNIKWICFGLVCKNYKKSLSSLMQVYLSIFGYILTKSVV